MSALAGTYEWGGQKSSLHTSTGRRPRIEPLTFGEGLGWDNAPQDRRPGPILALPTQAMQFPFSGGLYTRISHVPTPVTKLLQLQHRRQRLGIQPERPWPPTRDCFLRWYKPTEFPRTSTWAGTLRYACPVVVMQVSLLG